VSDFNNSIDSLLPAEMAARAEHIGVEKTRLDPASLMALPMLAGAFIAFGSMFSIVVTAGADGVVPYGIVRLLGGVVFSLGLVLVIVGGAELFTGNNLMVMACASGKVAVREVLRAWSLVYLGNLIGSVALALLIFLAAAYGHGRGAVGAVALASAEAKASLTELQALIHGILANVLVCLATWLCYGARSTTDKILAIIFPIAAFAAAGFEHSIANMFLLSFALMTKFGAPADFWNQLGLAPSSFPNLDLLHASNNLLWVICDALAETFSINLCREYRNRIGRVLHHNVDKALLCGGRAVPAFGGGEVTEPIRIFLAGRAVSTIGGEVIPVRDIAIEGSRGWLKANLHALDVDRHARIEAVVRQGSAELQSLFSRGGAPLANDTSFGVGHAPLSPLETLVLAIEQRLHGRDRHTDRPAWGEDIKGMAVRNGERLDLTIACAMIGRYIDGVDSYLEHKAALARPALLPEDIRYMHLTPAELQSVGPRLASWLTHVFRFMGGYVSATGVLALTLALTAFRQRQIWAVAGVVVAGAASIGWMAAVNFMIDSDFKWVLLGFALTWAASIATFAVEARRSAAI